MSRLIEKSRFSYGKLVLYTGFAVSFGLLVYILAKINWELFIATLTTLDLLWLFVSGFLIMVGVYIRSLRWNLITENDTKNFKFFWESANLGYLGNLIYPARAGEIIRIIALKRFTSLPEGRIIASAIIDRLADGLMLPLFICLLLVYFGNRFAIPEAVYLFAAVFLVLSLLLIFFIIWGSKFEEKIVNFLVWLPSQWVERISQSYNSIHGGASTLTVPLRLFKVAVLTILAFLTDTATFFVLFISFGWNLPVVAAIILCIFIFAGSALPSFPGYFGIYQVACILALYSFGISATAAVAYSLVMQGISYGLFLSIGGWIIFRTGISLNTIKTQINKDI